jgi:hypothetical protein
MRAFIRALIITSLLFPVVSQAAIVWSTCTTITSVSNYLANDNQFIVTLSGTNTIASTCSGFEGQPAIFFNTGSDGVTSSNIGTLLAMAVAAFQGTQQVMIAYDNSTSSCYGQVIAMGGYSGQCP